MVSRHEVQRISDFAEIKTGPFGSALHQADYKATGTPIVTVEHLGERGIIHENLPLVGEEDLKRLSTYKCREGDILFSRVGSIDRNAIVKREEVDWLFSGRLLRVRVDRRKVDSGYLSQVFHTESFKDKVRSVAVGQTMPSLNTQILGGLTVNLPSLDEQKVVAGRLGSADQLIESLKRLVSKKQAIKQGMMQELLTRKTRLSGFKGSWSVEKLGNILRVRHGRSQAQVEKANGRYPILATGGEIGRTDTPIYSHPSVLIGRKGTIDRPQYRDEPFWTVDTLFYTEISSRAVPLYVFYLFKTIDWKSMNEASGVPSLGSSRIESIEIALPPLEEQKTIAQVLQDADEEISALELRLESARNIKQGMMQELLTGRTRLPIEEVSS